MCEEGLGKERGDGGGSGAGARQPEETAPIEMVEFVLHGEPREERWDHNG